MTLTNAPAIPAGWVTFATGLIVVVLAGLGVVAQLIHTARTNTSEEASNG